MLHILSVISAPLIGALIGVSTNYIAVRMLFRPLRPVYLFGKQLPFTPGIIPKGQARLAHAVGKAVGSTLLTAEDLKQALLSDDAKHHIHTQAEQILQTHSEVLLGSVCRAVIPSYDDGRAVIQEKLTEVLADRLTSMQLGDIIAQQVVSAVSEKLSGSFLGRMLGDDMLQSFAEPIRTGIDRYLDGNGYALLLPQVQQVWSDTEQKTVGDADALLQQVGLKPADLLVQVYETVVCDKIDGFLGLLDPAKLVEQKVAAMPPEDLEELVLSVMRRELNALIALGAVIGFILGLLNLVI